MRILAARLLERRLEEREAEQARLKGEHVDAGWGNQIRSYVLQPYQMVKDLRTGTTSPTPSDVLDGDLDPFMETELARRTFGGGPDAVDSGRWTRNYPWQRFTSIGAGATEVQKNIIADRAIQLPKK